MIYDCLRNNTTSEVGQGRTRGGNYTNNREEPYILGVINGEKGLSKGCLNTNDMQMSLVHK